MFFSEGSEKSAAQTVFGLIVNGCKEEIRLVW